MAVQPVANSPIGSYPVLVTKLANTSQVQSVNAILPFISKVDQASDTVSYTGYALRGTSAASAGWFIFKTEISGNVTSVTFASDPFDMTQIWDSRAGLSYS